MFAKGAARLGLKSLGGAAVEYAPGVSVLCRERVQGGGSLRVKEAWQVCCGRVRAGQEVHPWGVCCGQ